MKKVLQNFSFAKQRFESEAAPRRGIACALQASMLFLTSEVDDPNRNAAERKCAQETLTVFNACDLTLWGLESDLATHGTEFLRFFDVRLPDPALLPRRLRRFNRETAVLFLDAKILHTNNNGTITWIILDTLDRTKHRIFYWKNEARPIGWVGDHAVVRGPLQRVQTVVRLLLETMALEFHDDLFPQWWEVFDLHGW